MQTVFLFLVTLLIIILRVAIYKKASVTKNDQYFWLMYRNDVQKNSIFPPRIKQFILDLRQYYPPLFGYFLSILPQEVVKKEEVITLFFSLIRLGVVFSFFCYLDAVSVENFLIALIVYLSAPILVYYDNQINPRIFGAILVDILLLLFYAYFEMDVEYAVVFIIGLTPVLMFTHKMSLQLYLFILTALSLYYLSWVPLFSLLCALVIALWFGYKKYLLAHIEIVKFWNRNALHLGAHAFKESGIYGIEGYAHGTRLHAMGIKSFVKKISLIIGFLPLMILFFYNFEVGFFGVVSVSILLFSLMTAFVRQLLCLGSGPLYIYNLVTVFCFSYVTAWFDIFSFENTALFFVTMLMTLYSVFKFYNGLKVKKITKNVHFEEAVAKLKESGLDRVLTIPFQLPNELAYKSGKTVFWGGHGYGFLWLERYHPVMRDTVENAIRDWNLGAVFLQKEFWPEFFKKVDQSNFSKYFENEKYVILGIKGWEDREVTPAWAKEMYPAYFENEE